MTPPTAPPRYGIAVRSGSSARLLGLIRRAEAVGVDTVWSTMSLTAPDTPTLFAAALATTERVTLGTAIVPAFTRHPLTLALQAKALDQVAPGRLRLGIGTGNLHLVEELFQQEMRQPLRRMRDYLEVLVPAVPEATPVLLAALGPAAYRLAGELADGALAWLCPVDYLLDVAVPAVAAGAEDAGRPPPPVIGHVPVALATDRDAVLARASEQLGFFGSVDAYAAMFARAGFPVSADGALSPELLDDLVVSGTPEEVAAQLRQRTARGLPELMVTLLPALDQEAEQDQLMVLLASLTERE